MKVNGQSFRRTNHRRFFHLFANITQIPFTSAEHICRLFPSGGLDVAFNMPLEAGFMHISRHRCAWLLSYFLQVTRFVPRSCR